MKLGGGRVGRIIGVGIIVGVGGLVGRGVDVGDKVGVMCGIHRLPLLTIAETAAPASIRSRMPSVLHPCVSDHPCDHHKLTQAIMLSSFSQPLHPDLYTQNLDA